MEKIEAYKTKSGQIFENEEAAKKAESEEIFVEKLTNFVESRLYDGVNKRELIGIIDDYSLELLMILEERHRKA